MRARRPAARPHVTLRLLTDRELMALASDGDADAFEAIYERHATAAYSLAFRICGAPGPAEDVVQEAFLTLWRRRDSYDPMRGEVRGWLLGIVHNSAIDKLRHSGMHERRRASADGIEERLEAPDRTELEVERREQAGEIRSALETLPAEQRHVIELAYFGGLTHAQIASALETPVGTIKGRMRLGLLKLHAQLAPAGATTTGRVAT